MDAKAVVQSWHEPLGEREQQILGLISDGLSNREIAQKLSLSLDTIKWYNKQLFSKLGVSSRTQAAATARQYGLLDMPAPSRAENKARSLHNLPHIPTSFIGRESELAEIKRLLQASHLVVLTGAGGSGKTRLALQAAYELVDYYPDGVWLVELAPLSDPSLVPNAIADVLRVNQSGEAPLTANIQHFLRSRRMLLVLDNFEHLPEASSIVGELIASAPQISILVTSRERLHVYGEQEYLVQPLDLPDLEGDVPLDLFLGIESVSLFVERARAVKQELVLQPEDTAAVARMCVHLDGLPLALELAASCVKILPLAALAERLDGRLSMLTGGPRDLPARQRTLRNTIDWSYNLLDEAERILFSRLSVFRGGGSLDAVEGVCADGLPGDLIAVLSSLVDKSLVRTREGADGELRFEMLETIREYALERLVASGEMDSFNRKHADYFAGLSKRAAREIRYARQRYWFARLRSEYDNLRTALAWSLDGPEVEPGLRITAALSDYWYYVGHHIESRYWTDLALENLQGAPPVLQAGVLLCIGHLHMVKSNPRQGKTFLLQAIDLYTKLGDERNVAWAWMYLSALNLSQPDKYREGVALCQKCLETFQCIGDLSGQAQALNILGEFTRLLGELEESRNYYEQCLQVVEQTGEQLREGMLYANLGFLAYRRGDYRDALQLTREYLRIVEAFRNDYGILTGIASISGPLAALGRPERAARLIAGAEKQLEVIGAIHQPSDMPEIEAYHRVILDQIGDDAFQAAWEAGSHLTIPELVDLAFEDVPED